MLICTQHAESQFTMLLGKEAELLNRILCDIIMVYSEKGSSRRIRKRSEVNRHGREYHIYVSTTFQWDFNDIGFIVYFKF